MMNEMKQPEVVAHCGPALESFIDPTGALQKAGLLVVDKPTVELKAGDILYSSWGYDQTNIDFYEVVKGAEAGGFVTLCQLKNENGPEIGFMTAMTKPASGPDRFMAPNQNVIGDDSGKPFKRKLRNGYRGAPSVRICSYEYASPWDGQPKNYSWYA